MRRAISAVSAALFMNTSSPKLMVPTLSVAISGASAPVQLERPGALGHAHADRAARRGLDDHVAARRGWRGSRRESARVSCEARPSSSRTCRWITVAPALAQRSASSAELVGGQRQVRVLRARGLGADDGGGDDARPRPPDHVGRAARPPAPRRCRARRQTTSGSGNSRPTTRRFAAPRRRHDAPCAPRTPCRARSCPSA